MATMDEIEMLDRADGHHEGYLSLDDAARRLAEKVGGDKAGWRERLVTDGVVVTTGFIYRIRQVA